MIHLSRLVHIGLLAVVLAASTVDAQISRIINGHGASEGEWPWMVTIFPAGQDPANPIQGHFCGGALVAPSYVVTAAHCVADLVGFPEEVEVVVGRTLLSSVSGARRAVKSIVVHPSFNGSLLRNDIALLKLVSPVPQMPVELVLPGEEALWEAGTLATIIGWGQTNANLPIIPDLLQEAIVPIQSDLTCHDTLGLFFDPSAHLCAGTLSSAGTIDGVDSCYGDSGSPLMVPSASGWKLAGITSWGFGCASSVTYGVYTRAAAYANWVYSFPPAPPIVRAFPGLAPYDAPTVGTTLTCLPGQWSGDNLVFTYQWFRSGLESDLPITGAHSASYVLSSDDVDQYLYCLVTATNVSGVANGASDFVGPVYDDGPQPEPTISPLDVTGPRSTKQRAFCKKRKCQVDVRASDDRSEVAGVEAVMTFQAKDCVGDAGSSRSCVAANRVRILDARALGDESWRFSFRIKRAGSGKLIVRARDSLGNIQSRPTRVSFSGS
ncbi:MAG: serine protease [Deltaproteobacteria bacterium]|nr:serine protease [Deltaproteobacteria bacterium]